MIGLDNKYVWVSPLTSIKGKTVIDGFTNHNLNKLWADQRGNIYNSFMKKKWLEINDKMMVSH